MKREKFSATLSKLAYLSEEDIKKELPKYGFQFQKFFSFEQLQGFICECDEGQVLTFRGSEMKLNDWKANFDIRLKDTFIGNVSEGYYDILEESCGYIVKYITDANILLTGHSCAAAYSGIFSKMLDEVYGFNTKCIVFEPPRYTDTHHFNDKVFYTINSADIIPRFPLKLMDRRHTGTLIYFNRKGKARENTRFIARLMNFILDVDDIIKDHDIEDVEKLWFKNWDRIEKILK